MPLNSGLKWLDKFANENNKKKATTTQVIGQRYYRNIFGLQIAIKACAQGFNVLLVGNTAVHDPHLVNVISRRFKSTWNQVR